MTVHRSSGTRKPWIVYYIILGLAIFGAFTSGMNIGLSLDVKYSTYLGKAGIDYLNLQYLGGAVIWTALALTALFMLSDPRVSPGVGQDGKRHLYMHSKLLGLLRLFRNANVGDLFPRRRYYDVGPRQPLQWDIGENLDHAVLSKNGKLEWNDRFPVKSPNFLVGVTNEALGMSRRALSNLFAIILLPFIYAILSSGAWVYDVGGPFILWTLLLFLVAFALLATITRNQRILHFKMNRVKGIVIIAIVLASAIAPPAFATFLRAQSGQYINYQWNPAYVPTIQYTRWAYDVDSVTTANLSMITSYTNQTNVLNHIRIFTNSSAQINMRPLVGVYLMSIDKPLLAMIFVNGTEYWVSILQLVEANYANDVDVWRTQHLLLTHSEKILAVNAATTQTVDMSTVWNLTQTPQVYYGEGGLWSSVDEVYLNIPGFNETHLTSYKGPPSYNSAPDYTYKGFWLYWKFFWQGRFDFANGNYGNIKALEYRDVNNRLSNILLPNMQMDPDPYPVVDKQGNIYLLHWIWVDWQSPSDFAVYPEHSQTSILRLS